MNKHKLWCDDSNLLIFLTSCKNNLEMVVSVFKWCHRVVISFHVGPQAAIILIFVQGVCLIFNFSSSPLFCYIHFQKFCLTYIFIHISISLQDGRIKVGDRVVAVGDESVAGLTVDKVKTNKAHTVCTWRSLWCNYLWLACLLCIQVSSLILKHQVTVKLSISSSKSLCSSSPPTLPLAICLSHPLSPVPSQTLPVSSSSSSLSTLHTSPTGCSDWIGTASAVSDPLSSPIVPGRETTIEICKGNVGLGLSIVGGCDTLLVWSTSLHLTDSN